LIDVQLCIDIDGILLMRHEMGVEYQYRSLGNEKDIGTVGHYGFLKWWKKDCVQLYP
jgi:hypothetical protein